jgi:hypothetical protein
MLGHDNQIIEFSDPTTYYIEGDPMNSFEPHSAKNLQTID